MEAMGPDPNPDRRLDAAASDGERLALYGRQLADGVAAALPAWVRASVERLVAAWGGDVDRAAIRTETEAAGRAAARDVGDRLRRLLDLDVDEQRTNPMSVVRGAVSYPTAVLRGAGIPPVVRDRIAEARFPDDDYDLTPTTFADLDPELHEVGLRWGAAKAHVHLSRRRSISGAEPTRSTGSDQRDDHRGA